MEPPNSVVREIEKGAPASPGLVALNNAYIHELTAVSPEALAQLIDRAFAAFRVGEADAFLIAFDEAADYASPNFLWFRDRCDRFVYVDRIAVAAAARGRGLGRHIYEALFAKARASGRLRIVCEVNADPPNPDSDAFHTAMGFAVVGSARLNGGKIVRYYARTLSPESAPE